MVGRAKVLTRTDRGGVLLAPWLESFDETFDPTPRSEDLGDHGLHLDALRAVWTAILWPT